MMDIPRRPLNVTYTRPDSLLLLSGLGLGVLLAYLIVHGAWAFAFALVFAIPLVMVLNYYPFAAVILWLLLSPFYQATVTYGGRYVFWMLHRAMIPLALGMTILAILLNPKRRETIRLGWAELAIAVFVGIVLVGIFFSQPQVTATLILFYDRMFIPFCVYLLVRLTAPRKNDLKLLLWVAMITIVIQSAIGLMSWFAPQALPSEWLGLQGARTTGTLRHPSAFATTLIFCAVLLYQAAMNQRRGLVHSVLLLGCGIGAIGVFLSFGRGPWLGGLFAIAGLLVLYPKPTIRMAVFITVVMVILGAGVLAREVDFAAERLNDKNTTNARIIVADAMLTMVEMKPLFGWGYEMADANSQQFYSARVGDISIGREFQPSHNTYLTILTETGLVGFLLYMFPMIWWFVHTVKAWSRLPRQGFWSRSLLASLWVIVGAFLIPGNFTDMRFWPFSSGLWWMILGLIANLVYPYLKPGDFGPPRRAYRPAQSD